MSDEDDYMSAAFLDIKEDVRPGLTFSREVKRKRKLEEQKIESNKYYRTKSKKQLEEESRNAGMDSAIGTDNKGFAMLQKMGYKPGMKLGSQKESMSNAGLSEPIKIKLKTDRGGLGREEDIRRRIVEREERKTKLKVYKKEEIERLTQEFRERMRNKVELKYSIGNLRKSQKICQQFDEENKVTEPMRPWFWYSVESDDTEDDSFEDDSEEEEEDEMEPDEQLGFILDYLRTKYLYCFWCGIKYESPEDIDANCPGTEKDDHD